MDNINLYDFQNDTLKKTSDFNRVAYYLDLHGVR